MPAINARILRELATEVIADVREQLYDCTVSIDFDTYVARGPILTVIATAGSGSTSSRDFNFQPFDELHTARLVNSIVRFIQERFATSTLPDRTAADLVSREGAIESTHYTLLMSPSNSR
jgi:hypothetical protein